MEEIWNSIASWALNTGVRIIIALIILLISFRIVKAIAAKLMKLNDKTQKLDKTLAKTLINAGKAAVQVLIVVCLVGYLGIDTSGIAAVIASLGVCIGLAVNGALGNIAGGVLLLITRPYSVDDYIQVAGNEGTVEDIRLCHTKLLTVDNKVIYVPNSAASTASVVNFSEKELRRVDHSFSIAYSEDFAKAEAIVQAVLKAHPQVLQDPAPMVRVSAHGASAVELVCRAWVKAADYWAVYFDLLEAVKKAFDENGVRIPYQQLDVHVKND